MPLWIDRICAGLLVLVGCVHNFVAAPMSFDTLTQGAFWFIAGGVVLWFGGLINIVWLRSVASRREVWWAALITNAVLLAFAVTFALLMGGLKEPQGLLLVAVIAWLTARSLPFRRGLARS